MRHLVVATTLLVAAVWSFPTSASVITSSAPESGFNAFVTPAPTPVAVFDFGSATLASLDSISITLTINDGDTGSGDFDNGQFTLGLDGIDTGLVLDGFNNVQTVTKTITGAVSNGSAILAALAKDGMLAATLVHLSTNENFVTLSKTHTATLALNGAALVPLPATLPLIASAIAGLGALGARKKMRRS